MKITLQPNEQRKVDITSEQLVVNSSTKAFEFSAVGTDDVELNTGDIVNCEGINVASVRNPNSVEIEINYTFTSQRVSKNTQNIASVQEITNPIDVKSLPALQVQASVAAANDASDPATITLAAGETKLVLAENQFRHKAILVRGDTDLYNLRLGYKTAVNAQNGVWFAPQATAKIEVTKAVYAHNPSASTQTIIAQDTQIDTGA